MIDLICLNTGGTTTPQATPLGVFPFVVKSSVSRMMDWAVGVGCRHKNDTNNYA
jgi:hypothetical protein